MIPSVPKLAATVIVFRQYGNVLKLLMVKRSLKARFFAGYHVFPGGIYEEADSSNDWEKVFNKEALLIPRSEERVGRIAAVRELFEETGLLLSDPSLDASITQELRESVQKTPSTFLNLYSDHSANIPIDRVHPFQRWVTPPQEKWRYDTYFYLAIDTQEQSTSEDAKETTAVEWISPMDMLRSFDNGSVKLAPPTWLILNELKKYNTLSQLNEDCKRGFDVTAKIAGMSAGKDTNSLTLEVNGQPVLYFDKNPNGQPKYTLIKSNL